ncbi:MAG: hypothetical protein ACREI2_15410 [Nitrospiraceae bacterium]
MILLIVSGCVSQTDLDKVRRDLSSEIATVTSRTQADLRAVRDKVDAAQLNTKAALEAERKVIEALQSHGEDLETQVEALTSKVAAVNHGLQGQLADLRKAMQDANAQRTEDLTALRGTVGEVKQALLHAQERLSTLSAEAQRLQATLRSLATTIVHRYQSEAEALRQNLKEMELLAKDLDTVPLSPRQTSHEARPSP